MMQAVSSRSADQFGEAILKLAFSEDEDLRPFYSHTTVADGFEDIEPGTALHNRLLVALGLGYSDDLGDTRYGFLDAGASGCEEPCFAPVGTVTAVRRGRYAIAGFYEADGSAVAVDLENDTWAINTDIKCDRGWLFLPAPARDIEPLDHTELAIETEATIAQYRGGSL